MINLGKNNVKIVFSLVLTSLVMVMSSIVIYGNVSKPKFSNEFMEMGNKYLKDEDYEEAILSFDKLIKIDENNIDARLCIAHAYIGINKNDKAIEALKEAQSIDIENSKLLLEILEILKDIDLDIAYEVLQNHLNKVDETDIDSEIKELLELSKENPTNPVLNPMPGKYVTPIDIKLEFDEIRVGHSYYYTTDSSEPTVNSNKYNGIIKIEKDTTIKLIGYNKENKSTEVIVLEYFIDLEGKKKLENLVKESESIFNQTKVGTEIGNVDSKSKEKLNKAIDKAKKVLVKNILSYKEVDYIYKELNDELKDFKNNIIEPTDKSKLKKVISEAQNLYDSSTEGTKEGQYKSGSKSKLLKAMKSAKGVDDDIYAKQNIINKEVNELKVAMDKFKESKVKIKITAQQAYEIFNRKSNNDPRRFPSGSEGYFLGNNQYGMKRILNVYGREYYGIYHMELTDSCYLVDSITGNIFYGPSTVVDGYGNLESIE